MGLKGLHGNVVAVEAADHSNLEDLRVGDQLNITYTEAAAISVEETGG